MNICCYFMLDKKFIFIFTLHLHIFYSCFHLNDKIKLNIILIFFCLLIFKSLICSVSLFSGQTKISCLESKFSLRVFQPQSFGIRVLIIFCFRQVLLQGGVNAQRFSFDLILILSSNSRTDSSNSIYLSQNSVLIALF